MTRLDAFEGPRGVRVNASRVSQGGCSGQGRGQRSQVEFDREAVRTANDRLPDQALVSNASFWSATSTKPSQQFQERAWIHDANAGVCFDFQEIWIAADNQRRTPLNCSRDVLVVVRILTDRFDSLVRDQLS